MRRGVSIITRSVITGSISACALALGGCASSPTITGACDTQALHHEVEHLVEESGFTVSSVDAFTCVDDWALVVATLDEPGQGAVSDRFLLRRDADIWVLKAPESACVDEVIPEPVHTAACAEIT